MVDKSEKFRWLIRLGFAARGLVYALLGYMFLTSRADQASEGPSGVFARIQEMPMGTPLLYVSALGLFGYALYRLSSPAFDIENYGSDKKGIGMRIGHAASGLAHLVLAYTAFKFAQGEQSPGGGQAQQMAGTILSIDLGAVVLGMVGIGFLIAAFAQAKKAWSADFMARISGGAPQFVEWLGRSGYAARTVVFTVIGWSLCKSGWFSSESQVKSIGEAVSSLSDNGFVFSLVALGLLLFGIFSMFLARYRIVPDLDPQGRVPAFRGA